VRDAGAASGGVAKRGLTGAALMAAVLCLAGCGGHKAGALEKKHQKKNVPVFDLRPEQCLVPPKANPNLQVASITVVSCREPHTEEVYCVLPYTTTLPDKAPPCAPEPSRLVGSPSQDYPGTQALETFANAVCLDEFEPYVGTTYKESSLYYTYLYPSPRSWDAPSRRDRMVACILVSPRVPLTRSAKGSRL
jgi:hypothetical protein